MYENDPAGFLEHLNRELDSQPELKPTAFWKDGDLSFRFLFSARNQEVIKGLTIQRVTVDGSIADLPRDTVVADIAPGKPVTVEVRASSYQGKGGVVLDVDTDLSIIKKWRPTSYSESFDLWVPNRPKGR